MEINWIDTQNIYNTIINTTDQAAKKELYKKQLIKPWQQMMAMVTGHNGATNGEDPFAGAKAWHWLVPDQLKTTPDSLTKLASAQAWHVGKQAMIKATERFAPYADRIPIDCIEGWLILADPETSDPIGRGYTGATDWIQPRFIVQYSEPNDYNLPRLEGCVVHEMHHLIRSKVVPWNFMQATVTDYIVHEGLAESFAAALFGEDVVGYYVTDIDAANLALARTLISDNLTATGFDTLRAFIFGDYWAKKLGFAAVGMPDFGGYAVGYHVVQAYLQRTNNTIEEATFVPAKEIVTQSGYFD